MAIRQELVRRAIQRFGREELAKKLNTPVHLIDAWAAGLVSMPERKFLALADLLDKEGDLQ